ncbi:MAG TPA: adenosylcobalamin-dependent ribonucleoside-diphosphate reductase [Stellaceae bacterium]|nr:adenosylcobalamin-dependent ribonucleoside-diphosphate reductase [Stellaceae bacterium]
MNVERLADADISRHIWETKYRHRNGAAVHDRSIDDTWLRVARSLAAVEPRNAAHWQERFYEILQGFKFLPAGRILAGAGTGRTVTLFNCFVMGVIEDSIPSIFRALEEGAITMQQGGGIGYDFSTLRPRGARAKGVGSVASGPVSFLAIWDAMCGTMLSTGARRGAMMATLRCDHPDIAEFIAAKQQPGRLRNFNLSIQVTYDFMDAVARDGEWPLVFPADAIDTEGETATREWPGRATPVACRIVKRRRARDLWEAMLRAAYDYAEPGVLFIDRINRRNNLWYCERIGATNPCGEIPLPPYGACDLGSLNLTQFVREPFGPDARLDLQDLGATAGVAVRLLDNVIDASRFPLPQQAARARASRRIGLGITGLGDALIMLGMEYGSERSLALASDAMRTICHAAYRASIALGSEKGRFPELKEDAYLEGHFIRALPEDIRAGIRQRGIRNSHLLAIAPTGSISLLAGNVSSGLEPVFDASYQRKMLNADGSLEEFTLTDYAVELWRLALGRATELPPAFVTARELAVSAHLDVQAALQPFVDNSISKTINVPADSSFGDFREIYRLAYEKGLKGCTTFRPNPITGAVLTSAAEAAEAPHCCVLEREPD